MIASPAFADPDKDESGKGSYRVWNRHDGDLHRDWRERERDDHRPIPTAFPIIVQAGFDPYWFAIVLTINMEIGLISPPIGLNLFVINAIAPDIPTREILWGALPYVLVMLLAIVILCIFPGIVTWLPNQMLGVGI